MSKSKKLVLLLIGDEQKAHFDEPFNGLSKLITDETLKKRQDASHQEKRDEQYGSVQKPKVQVF